MAFDYRKRHPVLTNMHRAQPAFVFDCEGVSEVLEEEREVGEVSSSLFTSLCQFSVSFSLYPSLSPSLPLSLSLSLSLSLRPQTYISYLSLEGE